MPELDVRIRVLSAKTSSIKLGIEAPRQTRILRGELNEFGEQPFSHQAENSDQGFELVLPH